MCLKKQAFVSFNSFICHKSNVQLQLKMFQQINFSFRCFHRWASAPDVSTNELQLQMFPLMNFSSKCFCRCSPSFKLRISWTLLCHHVWELQIQDWISGLLHLQRRWRRWLDLSLSPGSRSDDVVLQEDVISSSGQHPLTAEPSQSPGTEPTRPCGPASATPCTW